MFLGVDGGGTKTAFCLVSEDGDLVAGFEAESAYYLGHPEGTALVARVLREGVAAVSDRAGVRPDDIRHGFFGLASYGEVRADEPALDLAARAALGHDRCTCGNDMVAGWAGSLEGRDGINVVSGTGSICYGERAGRGARVGGWGELFGDEGSGHWIGLRGLQVFSQMSDGRLPAGPLADALRSHLALEADLDLVSVTMLGWRGDRRRVAALATVVAQAARQGDEQALAILSEAAAELVRLVEAARLLLGFPDGRPVPVSHSGGVFSSPVVRDEFTRRLAAAHAGYELHEPSFSPVVGAALHAARLAGRPLTDGAVRHLRQQASRT